MNRIIMLVLIVVEALLPLLIVSCEKEVRPPAIGKPVISKITVRGATVESQILWDGGSAITECGFCWNITGNPTIEDFHTESNVTEGRFSCILDTLKEGTRYYIRSYARNRVDISYGLMTYFRTEAFRKPVVVSLHIHGVTHNTISCGDGNASDNTGNIISKGVCWSTSIDPTVDDQKIELGSGSGPIGCTIEGLQSGTVYYLRAYAINIVGISYGESRSAKTFDGCINDIEGNSYYTIRLGNQEWMLWNLVTSTFLNGDKIGTTLTSTQNIELEDHPVYQWAFRDIERYPFELHDYGRLYTWYAVTDSRKICPAGWHLPTFNEWNELITFFGGNAMNKYDFISKLIMQGRGFRDATGQYPYDSYYGNYWWSASADSSGNGYALYIGRSELDKVSLVERDKKYGFSVRCLKD